MSVVFYDSETGGLQPSHPTIQLAAIAVGPGWKELEVYEAKLRFAAADADPVALQLNHFNAAIWQAEAKDPQQVAVELSAFLRRHASVECTSRMGKPYSVARLAGHNIATFDKPRLDTLFKDHGLFLPAHPLVLDTLQCALWFFHERKNEPKDYKLGTLCKYFGIETDELHGALADCRAAIALARRFSED